MDDDDLTPLDVLLNAMRQHWEKGDTQEAVALAKAAAPYVHAKPAGSRGAGSLTGGLGGNRLDELCAAAFYRDDSAAEEAEGGS